MWLGLIFLGIATPVIAQPPQASGEQVRLAEGRALLAQGDASRASALATTLLTQFPKSAGVLQFAVDAELARAGSASALAVYDRWSGANGTEVPAALHEIARSALREIARTSIAVGTRVRILRALAADGDADAAAMLSSDVLLQDAGPLLAASAGNDKAVTALITQLQSSAIMAERRRLIVALGNSGSRRAVSPLSAALTDANPDIRAAAAEALGKLGGIEAIAPLKALLEDIFPVRYQASMALLQLKDISGLNWLRQLESNPEPGLRLAGVQATKSQADGAWLTVVRQLTQDKDPEIRRQAAELLAPHDAATARATLEPLATTGNPVQREFATRSLIQSTDDLVLLRRYLRTADAETQALAGMRTLEMTR
jgi:HEAT repeat protein